MPVDLQQFCILRDARRQRKHKHLLAQVISGAMLAVTVTALKTPVRVVPPSSRPQAEPKYAPTVGGSSRLTPDAGPGQYYRAEVANLAVQQATVKKKAQDAVNSIPDRNMQYTCMVWGLPVVDENGSEIPLAQLRATLLDVIQTEDLSRLPTAESLHASLVQTMRKVMPWFNPTEIMQKKLWRGSGRALGFSHKANKAQQSELRKANKAGQGSRLFQTHVTQYWDNAWIDVARFFQSTRFFNNPQQAERIEKMLLSMVAAGEALTEGSMIDSVWRPMHGTKNRQTLPLGLVARRWLVEVRGIDPHKVKDARPPAHVSTIIPETPEQKFERMLAYASKNPDTITDKEWEYLERLAILAGA